MFALGEICMLGFSMEEEEAEVLGHKEFGRLSKTGTSSSSSSGSFPLPVFTLSERTKSFKLIFPESLSTLMQVLMGYHLPTKSSSTSGGDPALPISADAGHGAEEQSRGNRIPSDVRAFSFITMGKFSLRNKILATKLVNVFLRELNSHEASERAIAPHAGNEDGEGDAEEEVRQPSTKHGKSRDASAVAVRSNALLVLGDMCIRYTHLVDRHVGMMAQCLQDPSVIVRRHSMILLTQVSSPKHSLSSCFSYFTCLFFCSFCCKTFSSGVECYYSDF